MTKEEALDAQYVKKTTTAIVAVVFLAAGFFLGIIYSANSGGKSKVRRITTNQTAQNQTTQSQHQPQIAQNAGKIMTLEKEVAANPTNAAAWAELGHAYFDSNQHGNAIRAYNKHLELNPGNPNVWTDLGIMHRRSGDPREAIRCFDKAASLDPQHRQSRFNKGVVLMHDLNQKEEAIKAWEDLLRMFPDAAAPDGRPLAELIKAYKK